MIRWGFGMRIAIGEGGQDHRYVKITQITAAEKIPFDTVYDRMSFVGRKKM